MLSPLRQSVKKGLCFIPKAVHHSLLIDKEIGVSICNKDFCLCDNMINKIIKEQSKNVVSLSIEKDEKPKQQNTKCD
jgi:hypothetical protein